MADYILIAVPEDIQIQQFKTSEELVQALLKLRQEEMRNPSNTRAIMLWGSRIYLSKGDDKYVMFPDGSKLPLSPKNDILEPDEEGFLVERVRTESPDEGNEDVEEIEEVEEEDEDGDEDPDEEDSDL